MGSDEVRNLTGTEHADLSDNATATLYDNARATLHGNATATLSDNATATLHGNARARLYGNARARLRDFTIAHVLSSTAKADGPNPARIIRVEYPSDIREWARLKCITIDNDHMLLWKSARLDGTDFHSGAIDYTKAAEAPDWDPEFDGECGRGLHLADSPDGARLFVPYNEFNKSEYRMFEVRVHVDDCICCGGLPQYPMKLRARRCEFVKEWPTDYAGE